MRRTSLLMLVLALTGFAFAGHPPEPLGSWSGRGVLLVAGQEKAERDTVDIHLLLTADYNVTGNVGEASLEECHWSSNRGRLLRWLNWKTDWIVKGNLRGCVTDADTTSSRQITIPFNLLEEGTLRGGIMVLHGWRYPDPLLTSPGLWLLPESTVTQTE